MKILGTVCFVAAVVLTGPAVAQDCDGCMHGPHAQHEQPAQPGESGGMRQGMGGMHSMVRHHYVMREGLPDAYRELTNPLTATEAALARGRQVYTEHCATCHGETGEENGPASAGLDPQPSNIARLPRMPMMSSDPYLYWTVAEGGVPIGTAMPAFKELLTPDDLWSVILTLREGVGSQAGDASEHDASGHPAAGH
jgi:mono/diheme cytochrome c family protein